MKILAVDDEETALSLLKEALASAGQEDVRTCASAAEAFEIILTEDEPFDCFLFDIQMPGMDGIDLCKEVRAIPAYRRTPIIMVTGMSEKSFVDRAFAAGATDYLTKPFDPLEVGVRIGLAEELNGERKCLTESTDVIELLIQELDKVTRHRLEDPIEIGRIDRVLGYPAFENYLLELTRGVFVLSSLFAVKVKNVETVHAKLPPLEFREVLARSARAITGRLREHEVFLAYRGNGVFVGVVQRSGARVLQQMGDEVRIELVVGDADIPPELPGEVSLMIGDPVMTRMFQKPGSLRNLRAAIESAESKLSQARRFKDPLTMAKQDRSRAYKVQKLRQERELREEYEEFLRESLEENIARNRPAPVRPHP